MAKEKKETMGDLIQKDAMNAVLKYDAEKGTFAPEHHRVYITLSDTAPILIADVPDILDNLGLKEARQKMDKAHNDMIKKKFDLAIFKVTPGLYDDKQDPLAESPFDIIHGDKQERKIPSPEQVQYAIDAKPYADPEYRERAKDYLEEVLPVLETEYARLVAEVNTAQAELAEITLEYRHKVSEAAGKLSAFNAGVKAEWQKFETANTGSRTPENFIVTSRGCTPIVYYSLPRHDQVEGLRAVRKAIDDYEAQLNKGADPETVKQNARYSARNADPIKLDSPGFAGSGALAALFGRKK